MNENLYFLYRIIKGYLYSILFMLFRIFPIDKKKIVVCCFMGNGGYGCSAKYIIENIEKHNPGKYKVVWLVNDISKPFPDYVKKVKRNFLTNAYHLSTAKIWIENEKKDLGVLKRKSQVYINTWHGPIGFKTCGALRKGNWSKIGRLVSINDCRLTDYYLSNSKWCTDIHTSAYPYDRKIVCEIGMPRTDPLINDVEENSRAIRKKYGLGESAKILIFAPTFRNGIQKTKLSYDFKVTTLDFEMILKTMHEKFGGEWYIFIRLHPLVSAHMGHYPEICDNPRIIDISQEDDLYQFLAGTDALITDFSSCAFDACYKKIPVFLYADDFDEFTDSRELYWKLEEIPFPLSRNNEEIKDAITSFNERNYKECLERFFKEVDLKEKGTASEWVGNLIRRITTDD